MFDWLFGPTVTVELTCCASKESNIEPKEWVISKDIRFNVMPRVGEFIWHGSYTGLNQVATVGHYSSGWYKKTVVRMKDPILPYQSKVLEEAGGWTVIGS